MYHYANRPGLSTERSRQTIRESYNTSVNGLPGNDGQWAKRPFPTPHSGVLSDPSSWPDSGAMGSYVAFHLLGLYPLPATRQFLISSPFFPKYSIRNSFFGTTTTVIAHGFEGNGSKMIYIKVSQLSCQITTLPNPYM